MKYQHILFEYLNVLQKRIICFLANVMIITRSKENIDIAPVNPCTKNQ